jgi:hypothetical protein
MVLDEHQRGRLVINGLGDPVERAVLVVSAMTPVTTEVASYQYEIQPATFVVSARGGGTSATSLGRDDAE